MGMSTSTRSGQLCPRCASKVHVRESAQPQPLLTAIPALFSMSKQVINDSVGLVLDPWSWKARLVGTSPMWQEDEDGGLQKEPTHKVKFPPSTRASVGQRGKKTVQFVEPEKERERPSGAEHSRLPIERSKLELYEVVSPSDDPPRLINVDYDKNTNHWRVDESATFPDREDPAVMICSKSVLRAMECAGDRSIAGDLAFASSANQPQFHVNRLPDEDVIRLLEGDLAKRKNSSHDLFRISNLEEFLLHTHQDPRRTTSVHGGQYMKHWLIDIRQLANMLSNPGIAQRCKSAFWYLVTRGFVEKVTLQLWAAGEHEPVDSADIENLDWITWVRAYKGRIPESLRQDLDRALVFFQSGAGPAAPWPPLPYSKLSIMSHKGITSGITTETTVATCTGTANVDTFLDYTLLSPIPPKDLGKAGLSVATASTKPQSTQKDDGQVKPWVPSAKDARPPRRMKHLFHASSPQPFPTTMKSCLPDTDPTSCTRPTVSRLPRLGGSLSPEKDVGRTHKLSDIGSLYSASSIPPSGPPTSTFRSEASVVSPDSADKELTNEEGAFVTEKKAPAKVDYGRETGGLVEPCESSSSTSRKVQLNEECAAARVERTLRAPKAGTSAYERKRTDFEDPGLADSRKRAQEIRERLKKHWASAHSLYDRTNDNSAQPSLDVYAAKVEYPEFSYQLDDVLYAEQRFLAREWAHTNNPYDRPWSAISKTSDAVKDALPHFRLDARLAEIPGMSDKLRNQLFEYASMSVGIGSDVKADTRMCKQQRDMANGAVTQLKCTMDVANKEARETRDGQDQQTEQLAEIKEDLAQLSESLRSYAERGQSPTGESGTVQHPQALVEDKPQCNGNDEVGSMPAQAAKAEMCDIVKQSMRAAPVLINGSGMSSSASPPKANGGMNGLGVGPRSISLAPDPQSVLQVDSRPCRNSNFFPTVSNGFHHAIRCAGPPDGDGCADTNLVNSNLTTESDHGFSRGDRDGDQSGSQADSDASAESIKSDHTNGTLDIDEDHDGVSNNGILLNGTLTPGPQHGNSVCVACPEEPPNGTRTAAPGYLGDDVLSAGPGDFEHSAVVADPGGTPNGVSGDHEYSINSCRHGPSAPGKKKGGTRKKGTSKKKGKWA